MTRFRLGLAVSAVLITLTFLVLAWVMKRPGGADANSLPEPVSYAKPSPDGRRVFVAFGSAEYEAGIKDESTRRYAADVRAKYPRPGLYHADDPSTPIAPATTPTPFAALTGNMAMALDPGWSWDSYTPDDNVFLTSTGSAVVRIDGEWWKTKAYPAGKRLAPEVEQALLESPAVTFLFADGRPPRTYLLNELIDTPGDLPHSPEHILWPAGAALNPNTNQFHLFTQDSTKITFDATTGEIIDKGKNGLGNPVAQVIMWVTIGLTLLVLGGIVWFAVKYRRAPAAAPTA